MGRNFRAARVLQRATDAAGIPLFASTGTTRGRVNAKPPAWFKAVQMVQPSETLTRPYPIQHGAPDPRRRAPRSLYKPTKLVYPEDELRQTFYRDHPWELARPRVIMELDGKDARYVDWSRGVRQPGVQLSGECVVQRQLWLMENEGKTKEQAYDEARREFYALRQQEEIEGRIAVEEARHVGAYFGKGMLQVGMELEDKTFESWKRWATAEITLQQARSSSDVVIAAEEPAEAEPVATVEVEVAEEVVTEEATA